VNVTRTLPSEVSASTCADDVNRLRHIRNTFLVFRRHETEAEDQQYLTDIIVHLEAAMEVLYRCAAQRPEEVI
jgi:hypothetical protein